MLAALALGWPLLLLRAVFAMAIGIVTFAVPVWSTMGLVLLLATYTIGDGAVALLLAVAVARAGRGATALFAEALLRVAVGLFALFAPARAALAFVDLFALWAVASGAAAIALAIALRQELAGEWPLPLAGALSIICGVMSLTMGATLDARWIVGPYITLFGFTLLALSLRLRQLALEIAASL
jgi:uncharacterized membrane protein HdeD (DUF308 family)